MNQIWIAAALLLSVAPAAAPPPVEAMVLGIAQDGGVPHLGCRQKLCLDARRDRSKRRLIASLGLVDRRAGKRFLIDATPDFRIVVPCPGRGASSLPK
jgi:hypothetical protein